MKPLLVGEAPSRRTDGGEPFTGASGERIAALAGAETVADAFDVRNVFDRWPGYDESSGGGSAFAISEARARAEAIADEIAEQGYERVIFVGLRVLKAFGYREIPVLEWHWDVDRGFEYAVLPHPSGVNRWWNRDEHRADVAEFLVDARRRS